MVSLPAAADGLVAAGSMPGKNRRQVRADGPEQVMEWARTGRINWGRNESDSSALCASDINGGAPSTPSLSLEGPMSASQDSTSSDAQASKEPILEDDKLRYSMFPVRCVVSLYAHRSKHLQVPPRVTFLPITS